METKMNFVALFANLLNEKSVIEKAFVKEINEDTIIVFKFDKPMTFPQKDELDTFLDVTISYQDTFYTYVINKGIVYERNKANNKWAHSSQKTKELTENLFPILDYLRS